jgi:photosystem II stability/assembly factor-like uncharacterized protein
MERIFISTLVKGIARATCANGAWQVESLLQDQQVNCLAADPHNPTSVYAGTQGNGIFYSDNAGKTWQSNGLAGRIVKALAVSPTEPGVIYAGTKPALVYKSTNSGATWHELESFRRIPWRWLWLSPAEKPFTCYVQALAVSPTNPNHIVAGIEAGAVVMTKDGGLTWSRHTHRALRDCHSIIFHASNGSFLYEGGGTGGGAAFSADGGYNWHKLRRGLDRHYGWAVAVDPAQPKVWYVSLSPGPSKAHTEGKAEAFIFRRENNAWRKLAGGLPQPLDHMPYALLTDPNSPGHIYAGLSNGDIWQSLDHGDNWHKLNLNMGGIHRTLIAVP